MYVSHFTTSSFCPVTITVPQTPLDLVTNPIEKTKYWSLNYWLLYYLPSFDFSNSLIVLQFTLYTYRITACKLFPFFVPKITSSISEEEARISEFSLQKKISVIGHAILRSDKD